MAASPAAACRADGRAVRNQAREEGVVDVREVGQNDNARRVHAADGRNGRLGRTPARGRARHGWGVAECDRERRGRPHAWGLKPTLLCGAVVVLCFMSVILLVWP